MTRPDGRRRSPVRPYDPAMKRALAVVAILVAGILSLPLAALPFSSEGSENWILPVALGRCRTGTTP